LKSAANVIYLDKSTRNSGDETLIQARIRLDEMWGKQARTSQMNRDLLLAFVRAEIEIQKSATETPLKWLKVEQLLVEQAQPLALVISRHGLVIHLEPFTVISLQNHKQLFKAAAILNEETLTKETFFARIWGSQRFAPSLHDTLIRRLLYRMRRDMKLQVKTEKQILKMESGLYIL
jgi:hypothetical protein